jgi:hypothetical protein
LRLYLWQSLLGNTPDYFVVNTKVEVDDSLIAPYHPRDIFVCLSDALRHILGGLAHNLYFSDYMESQP